MRTISGIDEAASRRITENFNETVTEYEGGLPRRIVSMIVYQDRLFVATEQNVYVKDDDDIFRRVIFAA